MKALAITLSAAALCATLLTSAHADAPRANAVPGEKIDSGLGDLPRYGSVTGQKVDSGLGDLPHYRYWADKSGRAPLGVDKLVAQADAARK